jgi:hypothetical protein
MTFRFDFKLLVIRTKTASHTEFRNMIDMRTNSSNNSNICQCIELSVFKVHQMF